MYKKITHNIFEEHFDNISESYAHAEMQHGMVRSARLKQNFAEDLIKLRMDSRDHFYDYAMRLRLYLTSLYGSATDLPAVEEYVYKNVNTLSDIIVPYYGEAAATELEQYMYSFMSAVIEIFKAIKAGTSIDALRESAVAIINNISKLLSTLNPTFMPYAGINGILTRVLDALILQANSRLNGQWVTDLDALTTLNQLLVTGSTVENGFADTLARGMLSK